MSTFDIVLVFTLTATGAGCVGYGGFQLSKGTEYRSRALGEILIGTGFLIMGWDLLSGLSLASAFGAVVGMLGSAVALGTIRKDIA